MRIAIIGAGISGCTLSRLCKENGHEVCIFEKKSYSGGLVSCSIEKNEILFHRTGGHVFNSKDKDVLRWFWEIFSEDEFLLAKRNAQIFIDGFYINYPIENNLSDLRSDIAEKVINELLKKKGGEIEQKNNSFRSFLLDSFGKTLCENYFFPYNEKIWASNLDEMDIDWLDGKLPKPSREEIFINNILKKQDKMPHSTFYYPISGGSQFIIEKLKKGIDVKYEFELFSIELKERSVVINEEIDFDAVVYTGDVRSLVDIVKTKNTIIIESLLENKNHHSHGTTSVLCECDSNNLSWLYLPEKKYSAHRIIYTGNFSKNNNGCSKRSTCVVEFSNDIISSDLINRDIESLPGNLSVININREKNSYIMHVNDTKTKLTKLKKSLEGTGLYLLGRFAEWEYYNMDAAIKAAIELMPNIESKR